MNLVAQFNFFWQKHPEYAFKPLEMAVYSYLLNICNGLGRKNPFNLSKERLMFEMGLSTEKPLDTARIRLREAGLIEFEKGNGRGKTTLYTLLPPPGIDAPERGAKNNTLSPGAPAAAEVERAPESPPERGVKNAPLSGTLSDERAPERGNKNNPHKGGTTLKKRKDSTAIEVDFPFQAFWDAYGKKRDRFKSEEKWKALDAPTRAAIMAHVPLYVAATIGRVKFRKDPIGYLNGRCWLDEDLPAPENDAPAPLTPAPSAPVEAPEMNQDFLAQQEAEAQRRRAERLAQRLAAAT